MTKTSCSTRLGPLAALFLGVALVPLREVTVASNFTLAFIALTILVGEFGGRTARRRDGAWCPSLSLDFFLTQPYMRLAIAGQERPGRLPRARRLRSARGRAGTPRREREAARRRLALVERALRQVEAGGPSAPALQPIADAARAGLPLAAVVVRDDDGGPRGRRRDEGRRRARAGHRRELGYRRRRASREWRQPDSLPARACASRSSSARGRAARLDLWGNGRAGSEEARRSRDRPRRRAAALSRSPGTRPPSRAASRAWSSAGSPARRALNGRRSGRAGHERLEWAATRRRTARSLCALDAAPCTFPEWTPGRRPAGLAGTARGCSAMSENARDPDALLRRAEREERSAAAAG